MKVISNSDTVLDLAQYLCKGKFQRYPKKLIFEI